MPHSFKKHWIIFRKLDTRIFIYHNRLTSENKKEIKEEFKQDLNKDRPYLIIEEDEKKLLILTVTTDNEDEKEENKKDKEDKPSFGRFGPIKCPCLDCDSYVRLDTKIFATWEFIYKSKSYLDLFTKNNKKEHRCLSESQFLGLREALDAYWDKENRQLIIIELGKESEPKGREKIKRKSAPLFRSYSS